VPAHDHPASLWSYYDGDSFRVLARMSFGHLHDPELRLLDVEAPEVRELRLPKPAGTPDRAAEPGAAETTAEVTRWMTGTIVEAKDLRWYLAVRTILTRTYDPREKKSFDRFLATVWPWLHRPADFLPDHLPATTPGPSLNEHLIGFLTAHGWTSPFRDGHAG
jgi:hypothetical protein